MTYAENRRRSILRIENHPDAVGGCYQGQKDNIAFDPYGVKPRGGRRASRLSSSLKGTSFPLLPLSSRHLAHRRAAFSRPEGTLFPPPSSSPSLRQADRLSLPRRSFFTPISPLFLTASRADPDRRDRRLFLSPEGTSFSPSAPPSSEPTCHRPRAVQPATPTGLIVSGRGL